MWNEGQKIKEYGEFWRREICIVLPMQDSCITVMSRIPVAALLCYPIIEEVLWLKRVVSWSGK
jgi:hypothetical protein